jgi:hypothetical protein
MWSFLRSALDLIKSAFIGWFSYRAGKKSQSIKASEKEKEVLNAQLDVAVNPDNSSDRLRDGSF